MSSSDPSVRETHTAIPDFGTRKVKNCFWLHLSNPERLAVLDLVPYGSGYIITRINVPREHRRQGYGRTLLLECLKQADEQWLTLYLEIAASGEMSGTQLIAWYTRNGFKPYKGLYRRLPNPLQL